MPSGRWQSCLVAAIYSRQPKAADFSTLALADVFELAALAGRYEVLALEGIVMEHLAALPVPAEEEVITRSLLSRTSRRID